MHLPLQFAKRKMKSKSALEGRYDVSWQNIQTCIYNFGSKHSHAQKLRAQNGISFHSLSFCTPDYWQAMHKEKAVILPTNRNNVKLKGLMTGPVYINHITNKWRNSHGLLGWNHGLNLL